MKKAQLIKDNSLIAYFLNGKIEYDNNRYYLYSRKGKLMGSTPDTWDETPEITLNKIIENACCASWGQWALFNTDWNWLMEVVEKIEGLGHEVDINTLYVGITEKQLFKDIILVDTKGISKIEAVYKACIEFIKWYNLNSK